MRHVRARLRTCKAEIPSELSSGYQNPTFPPRIEKKESEFWGAIVGVKVHQSTVGLGTHAGPNHDKKWGHGQRTSSPTLLGRAGPVLEASYEECPLGRIKWESNMHPSSSGKSSQIKGKCWTLRGATTTAALNARELLFQPH